MPITLTRSDRGFLKRVPSGLIVPFNSLTLPASGWSWFTSADGRFPIGAGNSYANAATGGTVACTATTDTESAHRGSTTIQIDGDGISTGSSGAAMANPYVLSHSHDITFDLTIAAQQLRLIKSTAIAWEYPSGAILLSTGTTGVTGLTRRFNTNIPFKASGSSISAITDSYTNYVCSTSDSHTHKTTGSYHYDALPNSKYSYVTIAGHDHDDPTFIFTKNLKAAYLSAWETSSGFASAAGMIAMWESQTPPTGWALCDGNNGTLDLTDYFIMFSDDTNVGTTSGDNTAGSSTSVATDGHEHQGSYSENTISTTGVYHASTFNHSHDLTDFSHVPPYYALTFIQNIGRTV